MKHTAYTTIESERRQLPDLKWIDKISNVMDSRFRVPGTNFRFGLDPILGLLPGVGDATSLAVSGLLIFYMTKYGASKKLVLMMAGNSILDAVVGSIPILGTIFDFGYKANEKNMRLLKRHYQEGKYQGSGKGILILVGLVIIVFILLILYGIWELTSYLFEVLGGAS